MCISMDREIKVSVIMPVYNAEKYLEAALDDVVNQTLKDIEIICVDDGSTDGSYEILQEYADRDPRFIILRQENSYAGVARNHGMSMARGKYLSFLDADDRFKADMLEKVYRCAEQDQADIVAFGADNFKTKIEDSVHCNIWLKEKFLPKVDKFTKNENEKYLFNFSNTPVWNKLYRRDFIEKEQIFFLDTKRWEDVYFVIMTFAASERISVVRENLMGYRVSNTRSLTGTREENILEFFEPFDKAYHYLMVQNKSDEMLNSFRNEFLGHFIGLLNNVGSEDCFLTLYNAFCDEYFEKFHIANMKADDFIDSEVYEINSFIREHSSYKYLYRLYRELKTRLLAPSKQFIFPFAQTDKDEKIILYGAGVVGQAFYNQVQNTAYCSIVAWVDKRARRFRNPKIEPIEAVGKKVFDHLVIALESEEIAMSVKDEMIKEYKIPPEKILWRNPLL